MTPKEYFMLKLAEKTIWEKIKKRISGVKKPAAKKRENRLIKKQLKEMKPKTRREKQIERLTGRKWSPGQYGRGAAIGAGVGTAGHVVGSLIEGAGKGTVKELLTPRKVARTAAIASLYGAAIPALRRAADVEAAKRGKF
jgi:hypothetical protein